MVIKRISGISEDDTSMADVSMADVSVDNGLNDSSMVMAMGPACKTRGPLQGGV